MVVINGGKMHANTFNFTSTKYTISDTRSIFSFTLLYIVFEIRSFIPVRKLLKNKSIKASAPCHRKSKIKTIFSIEKLTVSNDSFHFNDNLENTLLSKNEREIPKYD